MRSEASWTWKGPSREWVHSAAAAEAEAEGAEAVATEAEAADGAAAIDESVAGSACMARLSCIINASRLGSTAGEFLRPNAAAMS